MRRLLLILLACLPLFSSAATAEMLQMFESAVFTNSVQTVLPYRIFRVDMTTEKPPYPLVIFLHGSGSCGTNNIAQLDTGIPAFTKAILKAGKSAILVAPQCTMRSSWVKQLAMKPDYRFSRYPAPALRAVKDLCDELISNGEADPDRVYITGLSLGGFGVWDAAMRWSDFFAAAIPICAGGASNDDALLKQLAPVPLWAFHGSSDGNVSVDCSRRMIEGLKRVGGKPKYTEHENAGHMVWDRALGNPDVIKWLFEQTKKKNTPSSWLRRFF